MSFKKFRVSDKKHLILNFSHNVLSRTAMLQFDGTVDIVNVPLEIDLDTDIDKYICNMIDRLGLANESKTIMIVLPGLNILSGVMCRSLAEDGIPFQILNVVRHKETNEYYIHDIY